MQKRPKKSSKTSEIKAGDNKGLYYPLFLEVAGRKCVIVGGGRVAERKASGLLRAGADLTVISPEITGGLSKKKKKGLIGHFARALRGGDLKGALLVIAATDSAAENERAASLARKAGAMVNVVDTPSLCDFIVPSTVRRGPLQIAVSTSGASPAMARAIRKELEGLYGREFGEYLKGLEKIRRKTVSEIEDSKERRRKLKALASEDVIKGLRAGERKT